MTITMDKLTTTDLPVCAPIVIVPEAVRFVTPGEEVFADEVSQTAADSVLHCGNTGTDGTYVWSLVNSEAPWNSGEDIEQEETEDSEEDVQEEEDSEEDVQEEEEEAEFSLHHEDLSDRCDADAVQVQYDGGNEIKTEDSKGKIYYILFSVRLRIMGEQ